MSNKIKEKDLYAALLHEMKNNLVLLTISLDNIAQTGDRSHDEPLSSSKLLCQRVSERLMQALMIYKSDENGLYLNAIDSYSPEDFVVELGSIARSLTPNSTDVVVEIDDNLPLYWFFDRNLLQMAMVNAVHNSVAYAVSKITISAYMEPNGMICFSVKDDSKGYPEHILCSQNTDSPSMLSTGTGLGLRFAKIIAEAHENEGERGFLRLRNQDGAVFEVVLP